MRNLLRLSDAELRQLRAEHEKALAGNELAVDERRWKERDLARVNREIEERRIARHG